MTICTRRTRSLELFLLLLASLGFLCKPSFADPGSVYVLQDNATGHEEYLINLRALDGEEKRLFTESLRSIQEFANPRNGISFKKAVQLIDHVLALPEVVWPSTRSALLDEIAEQLSKAGDPGRQVVVALLGSLPPHQALAIRTLQQEHWWLEDKVALRRVIEVLQASSTEDTVQSSILWAFFLQNAFDNVRSLALELASQENSPELARAAATTACASPIAEEFRAVETIRIFRTSQGILRQEAALAISRYSEPGLELRSQLVSAFVAMARDGSLPSFVRGEAIEQLGNFHDNPLVLHTLFALLQQDEWFFGIQDIHGPEHSLVAIISALGRGHDEAIRSRLRALPIDSLSERERFKVAIVLNLALSKYRDRE